MSDPDFNSPLRGDELDQALRQLVSRLPVQQVPLGEAMGRVDPERNRRFIAAQLAGLAARGLQSFNCVTRPRVALLPAEDLAQPTQVDAALRYAQGRLQARALSPTRWPLTPFVSTRYNAALSSLAEGFDVVIAVQPSGYVASELAADSEEHADAELNLLFALDCVPPNLCSARGQGARWSLLLPSEPRALLAAWHGLVEPLLDALEGVGRERTIDPPLCRISPPVDADQIGQQWPAALAWRVGAGGSMRARAQILQGEQWTDLSSMNALIEILDIDRGRTIWCEQVP